MRNANACGCKFSAKNRTFSTSFLPESASFFTTSCRCFGEFQGVRGRKSWRLALVDLPMRIQHGLVFLASPKTSRGRFARREGAASRSNGFHCQTAKSEYSTISVNRKELVAALETRRWTPPSSPARRGGRIPALVARPGTPRMGGKLPVRFPRRRGRTGPSILGEGWPRADRRLWATEMSKRPFAPA